MACKCFKDLEEKATEQVLEGYKEGSYVEDSVEVNWQGGVFWLDGAEHAPMNLKINIKLRQLKKNKEPRTRDTNNELAVYMTYCPLCGVKFKEDEE